MISFFRAINNINRLNATSAINIANEFCYICIVSFVIYLVARGSRHASHISHCLVVGGHNHTTRYQRNASALDLLGSARYVLLAYRWNQLVRGLDINTEIETNYKYFYKFIDE